LFLRTETAPIITFIEANFLINFCKSIPGYVQL
jgi:hypothetical protein